MTRWVAEVGSNHNGDLDRAIAFVDKAAELGCWGVKFQHWTLEGMYDAGWLKKHPELLERKKWEMPEHWMPRLHLHARDRGIKFGLSPHVKERVYDQAPYVDFFKISSYALSWTELIGYVARAKRPIVMSTGMATDADIGRALFAVRSNAPEIELTLLYCLSRYPTTLQDLERMEIGIARIRACGSSFGYSDHSVNEHAIRRALNVDCDMIEFHLDLDGKGFEYPGRHCWLPHEIGKVILGPDWEERRMRHDPSDGKRPMKEYR